MGSLASKPTTPATGSSSAAGAADSKQKSPQPPAIALAPGCSLEVVAGVRGQRGHADGALHVSRFSSPTHLSLWRGSLIVADFNAHCIRLIDGVVGSPPGALPSEVTAGGGAADVRSIAALITATVPVLLKELAAIIADYSGSIGVRTMAGAPYSNGIADGHALREATFHMPSAAVVDDSDPVAGPQLIIADYTNGLIRCLNLRTEQVTTIAGDRVRRGA